MLTAIIIIHYKFVDISNFTAAEFMVTVPERIALPYGFETTLSCEMNIQPDRFQWKFYPSMKPYDPKAFIDLGNGTFHLIQENNYTNQGRKSSLNLLVSVTMAQKVCILQSL